MPAIIPDPKAVFLNVPFDKGYEPQFVALVATMIAIGRNPRCVLELAEVGVGRLPRLLDQIRSCKVSVHDLSRVGSPARFNMPFELGLACAVANLELGAGYEFILLERKPYRLQRTLSDLNGRDPYIHGGSISGTIASVLDALRPSAGGPSFDEAMRFYRDMAVIGTELKRRARARSLFTRSIFIDLVATGVVRAQDIGYIKA